MRRIRATPATVMLTVACAWIVTSGCLSSPRVETLLHESPLGVVSLREFPDPSFRAGHPLAVEPALLRKVLRGLHVREQKTAIEATLVGDPEWTPVFDGHEIDHLAPLLVDALAQATPSEEVRFRIPATPREGRRAVAGTVHAGGGTLMLSLLEFGIPPQRPGTLSQPSRSFNRARRWSLTFFPEAALVDRAPDAMVSPDGLEPDILRIDLAAVGRSAEPASGTGRLPEGSANRPERGRTAAPARGEPRADDRSGTREEELRRLRGTLEQLEERLQGLERELERR